MSFLFDLALNTVAYLPLALGAYISVLVLRFPDLTIEGSWCLGGIVGCIALPHTGLAVAGALGAGAGALCGALTGLVFILTGRVKLLAGLIGYYVIEAVGFHILGTKASVYLDHAATHFGLPTRAGLALFLYAVTGAVVVLIVSLWQKSRVGITARVLGETPPASMFLGLSLNRSFLLGLIVSNGIVGFGGALWGLYYGQASNIQGIGLVLKAFLALLLGTELLGIFGLAKRVVPASAVIGTVIFVFLSQSTEAIQVGLARQIDVSWLRPTDKQIVVAAALVGLLWTRNRITQNKGMVSQW